MASSPKKYINQKCVELNSNIKGRVLVAASGGVDSSVSAALLKRAGIRTRLIFIDSGYQRKNEPDTVMSQFKKMGYDIDIINAKKVFYKNTFSKYKIEDKEFAFRNTYFDLIIKYAKKEKIDTLVQGTQFYKTSTQIGHSMPNHKFLLSKIKLVEPVKALPKDHIRAIARELGLPKNITERMSFPGPGILMRFYGRPTTKKISIVREATEIVDTMLKKYVEIFKKSYQVFPYLLSDTPISYLDSNNKKAKGWIILIRSLQQHKDKLGYVYRPLFIPKKIEEKLVSDLMKIKDVARVCFDLSPKYGSGFKVRTGATIEIH